jgi:hypothetical protein
MDKLLELLGLGTPFLYAAGTYAFFHWLDSNGSDEAKAAFARFLDVKRYDRRIIATAIVGFFDRVYTYQLLRWRALGRSALITVIVTTIYAYEINLLNTTPSNLSVLFIVEWNPSLGYYSARLVDALMILYMLSTSVISDFISLFIVRHWLLVSWHRPVAALTLSSLIVLCVIVTIVAVRGIGQLIAKAAIAFIFGHLSGISLFYYVRGTVMDTAWDTLLEPHSLIIPASAVFLWLPLFGVSISIVRVLNLIRPMIRKAQWLLKEGKEHPLNAVGYVAAVIVFLATLLWRHLRGDSVVEHAFGYGTGLVLAFQ